MMGLRNETGEGHELASRLYQSISSAGVPADESGLAPGALCLEWAAFPYQSQRCREDLTETSRSPERREPAVLGGLWEHVPAATLGVTAAPGSAGQGDPRKWGPVADGPRLAHLRRHSRGMKPRALMKQMRVLQQSLNTRQSLCGGIWSSESVQPTCILTERSPNFLCHWDYSDSLFCKLVFNRCIFLSTNRRLKKQPSLTFPTLQRFLCHTWSEDKWWRQVASVFICISVLK